MATKKTKAVRKPRITTLSQLKAVQANYAELVVCVQNYIRVVRNQVPDNFRMDMSVKTAEGKTFRIGVWHDQSGEYIKPWGSYSMAPFIKA